jgi:hypothetical protein
MAVDTDRIIDWLIKNRHLKNMITDHDVHPATRTLVFNPDFPHGLPCDHLLVASYNATLRAAADPAGPIFSDTTVDYEHAWFTSQEHEKRVQYANFVLEQYMDEVPDDPRFGSVKHSWTKEWMSDTVHNGEVLLLRVSGYARYVERPDVFFRELPRDYEEMTNPEVSA